MPIGYSSPARNLFLLGSSGAQVVSNFFKQIDQASSGDFFHTPSEIRYTESDEKFILAGQADKTSPSSEKFGWIEKRQENGTQDWEVQVSSTTGDNTTLRALELDGSNLVAVGKTGDVPWIAKYTDGGVLDWQSTTNSGDVEYTGITVDTNGNYYACGNTPVGSPGIGGAQAFVEKFDSFGNPSWGKSALIVGRNIVLSDIAVNDRGHVIAVGYLEDDSYDKGYIVKIDTTTGDVMWDRTLEQNLPYANVRLTAIDVDNNDEIYICGNMIYDILFPSVQPVDGFIAKYTAEGNLLWQSQSDYASGSSAAVYYEDITIDNTTKKPTIFGYARTYAIGNEAGLISRYDPDGILSWRREINEGSNFSARNSSIDGDQSFIYLLFNDVLDTETYVYGKVSATGNGLGDFEYDDGTGAPLLQYITSSGPSGSDIGEKIGRLSDGSVRQDTSDLITYPFNANKLLFDDLATQVANKRRQMDSADSFEYSGSPAIRPADFQEMNLLGSTGFEDETTGGGGGTITLGAQTWSNDLTTANPADGFQTSNPATLAFDGSATGGTNSTATNSTASGNQIVWSPSQFPAANGPYTLEVLANGGGNNGGWGQRLLKVNGTTYHDPAVDPLPTDYITVSNLTEITELIVERQAGTSGRSRLDAIIINGTHLTDGQGITLPVSGTTVSKVKDQSGKGIDGVVNGLTHNAAGYWEFDGTNDYIDLPKTLANWYAGPYSIEMWFRANNLNLNSNLKGPLIGLSDVDSSGEWWSLGWDNSSVFNFYYWNGSQQNQVGSTTLSTATWYHAVFTHDSGTMTLYLNGSQDGTGSVVGTPQFDLGSTYNFTLGASASGYHDGDIGEVRIYDKSLTAAQVFQNYNATKSKYINEAPDTAPKIGPGVVYDSNLLLNYDFGNRATYDRAENLSAYSEDFTLNNVSTGWRTDAPQYSRATLIANTGIDSPVGTNNASRWQSGDQTNQELIYHLVPTALTIGETYTVSCWVRRVESFGNVQFYLGDNATLDVTSQVDAVPFGEWVRVSATRTITGENGTPIRNYIAVRPNGNVNGGDKTTIDIWGMNVNQGSTPGRYIKTYGSAITAPTTVKNLSSSSNGGTFAAGNEPITFNNDGYLEFPGTVGTKLETELPASTIGDIFTAEAWIYPTGFTTNTGSNYANRIFTCHGGTSNTGDTKWCLGITNAGGLGFGGEFGTEETTYQLSLNTYYHVVLVHNISTGYSIYVNGVSQVSSNSSSASTTFKRELVIGGRPAIADRPFEGRIGQARIYTRELTATEVSQNFNATRGRYGV